MDVSRRRLPHLYAVGQPLFVFPKEQLTSGQAVARLVQSIRFSGERGKPFWQDESYDHVVRNREEFHRIGRYIINNPVRAGLAPDPQQFPWSSAAAQ